MTTVNRQLRAAGFYPSTPDLELVDIDDTNPWDSIEGIETINIGSWATDEALDDPPMTEQLSMQGHGEVAPPPPPITQYTIFHAPPPPPCFIFDIDVICDIDIDSSPHTSLLQDLDDVEWFNKRYTFCGCCSQWRKRTGIEQHLWDKVGAEDYEHALAEAQMDVRDIFIHHAKVYGLLADHTIGEANSWEPVAKGVKRNVLGVREEHFEWWRDIALKMMFPSMRTYPAHVSSCPDHNNHNDHNDDHDTVTF